VDILCSSAVRNAIEHDKQVNSGLSSCSVVCTSAMKGISNKSDIKQRKRELSQYNRIKAIRYDV
jgi:hypothetical protein